MGATRLWGRDTHYSIKGDGATCAKCGETPTGRFQFATMVIWACSEEHAKDVWQAI